MTLNVRYKPGQRVRITQQVLRLERPGGGTMATVVEGLIVSYDQRKTGSWYAHSKDHKLWLDSVTLRKDDGEIVVVNLDQHSHVELVGQESAD